MVMTLLFPKSKFCGNFIIFLKVSNLLITNYLFKMQITKALFAVETMRSISVCNVFVMTSPFWHYREVTLDWLLVLDFEPIKTD